MTALPALFVSHGSPMHALDPGAVGDVWREVAARLPRPRAILMASAHWEADVPMLTGAAKPETIHDFYGFPEPLYRIQYRAPGEPELKATLVFRDPKGDVMAQQDRINDLSLRLTSPGGDVYWGNQGLNNSNWSNPGGQPNTIDTVENIFIKLPEPGNWTLDVIGSQIVEDANLATPNIIDAVYALVVTGCTIGTPPPPCYANCDLSTSAPVLTANDFQCFLNHYASGDPYSDCDGVGGLTANDFQCFLNAFAVGCP